MLRDIFFVCTVIYFFFGINSVNESIVFDASDSYDLDGFIVSYEWTFGAGETGIGISPIDIYETSGQYNISLIGADQLLFKPLMS